MGGGHVEVAQILLEKGADATVVDSCKRTSARGRDALEPMHTAAPHTFIKLPSTAAPLAGGARTDGEAHPCVCVCGLFVGLHWAALAPEEKGAHECSKILFAKDGITSLINTQSSSMSTPLHCALSRGHTELVKLLIDQAPPPPTTVRPGEGLSRAQRKPPSPYGSKCSMQLGTKKLGDAAT